MQLDNRTHGLGKTEKFNLAKTERYPVSIPTILGLRRVKELRLSQNNCSPKALPTSIVAPVLDRVVEPTAVVWVGDWWPIAYPN